MTSAPLPLPWMTQRLAGVLIRVLNLIGKTSIFSKFPLNSIVLLQMNPQTGRQQKENFTKPKWKNYDSTMFLSRIITSRYIAVKWYLRVYWLLPLSIVASFKKNRRFFRLAPTILLESTDDSFSSHRGCLEKSINFISKRSHFLLSPDSFSLHQLNQQTTWQKSYYINRHLPQDPPVFCWQNVHIEHTEPW